MNQHGLLASGLYSQILEFMNTDDYKTEKDNDDYIQSTINARFAIAKIFSGLLPKSIDERIAYLRTSLSNYQTIKEFIKEKGREHGKLGFNFSEQLRMCDEMCNLLPIKIDKIRMGFMN